jgi:hypothetical protein
MKVFISYSSFDLTLAQTVYRDMVGGGALAFQFKESAIIGKPSWNQVLDWISESDTFIVLISAEALKSKPVKEEIEQAHYSYINNNKPEKIVSAIVERAVKPPRLIERFTTVDLLNYNAGMSLLMKQLGLERKRASVAAPVLPLPDLAPLFAEFKKQNPGPTPAEQFSKRADTILANYQAVKPKDVKAALEATHLDQILSELSGRPWRIEPSTALKDYNKWFLGYDPGLAPRTALLSDSLLHWKPSAKAKPLDAPKLETSPIGLKWSAVPDATAYALEGSSTAAFLVPNELYRGTDTFYMQWINVASPWKHFRVKAVGGVFKPDSAWSNVLSEPSEHKLRTRLGSPLHTEPSATSGLKPGGERLTAPVLELTPILSMVRLSWTAPQGASDYVLERASNAVFLGARSIYEGKVGSYLDNGVDSIILAAHYRVKARGTANQAESDWSNVVVHRWRST